MVEPNRQSLGAQNSTISSDNANATNAQSAAFALLGVAGGGSSNSIGSAALREGSTNQQSSFNAPLFNSTNIIGGTS